MKQQRYPTWVDVAVQLLPAALLSVVGIAAKVRGLAPAAFVLAVAVLVLTLRPDLAELTQAVVDVFV